MSRLGKIIGDVARFHNKELRARKRKNIDQIAIKELEDALNDILDTAIQKDIEYMIKRDNKEK